MVTSSVTAVTQPGPTGRWLEAAGGHERMHCARIPTARMPRCRGGPQTLTHDVGVPKVGVHLQPSIINASVSMYMHHFWRVWEQAACN
jgi:hypothetical protein